jgi:hypothetical protein
VATSSGQFVRQIGSTMGVALFGAILTWGLTSELTRLSAANPAAQMQTLELSDLQRMAMERDADPGLAQARAADPVTRATDQIIRQSFSTAVVYGIIFSLGVLLLGFLLMLKIPGVRLQDRVPPPTRAPAPAATEAAGKT